jgi:hypothetical protein
LFEVGNYVEAGVWGVIALVFTGYALRGRGMVRTRCWQAAVAFLAFGLSDVVEVQTGAWWKPWWLLVWKGACILGMLLLGWDAWRRGEWKGRRDGGTK